MEKKKTKTVTIRLDEDFKKKIEMQADIEHRELSEFVRHCVKVYMEKIEEVRRITL